jgi:hypothetical protein
MVAVTIVGNISREATTPSGNIFADAMRGDTDTVRCRDGDDRGAARPDRGVARQ